MRKNAITFITASLLLLPTGAAAANSIQLAESLSHMESFTVTAPELEEYSDMELRRMDQGSVHLAGARARAIMVAKGARNLKDAQNPERNMDLSEYPVVVVKRHQVLVAQLVDPQGAVLMTAQLDPEKSASPKAQAKVLAQADE